jgi:hypothetical protein
MGASIVAYWPGQTREQWETMPGFRNDDKAFGNWMAELEGNAQVLLAVKRLKADAILTMKTDGREDEDVTWVTPEQLRNAALTLRVAVEAGAPEAAVILNSYEIGANDIDPIAEEFIRDLDDIVALTKWAEEQGATQMTLEVNW